jgi:hypothetical protein
MVPALYAAVAVASGEAIDRVFERRTLRAARALPVWMVLSVGALAVAYDVVTRGRDTIIIGGHNHELDDARSVTFMTRQRQQGDVLLATHFSLPAVWWYGDIPIGGPGQGGQVPGDPDGRVFEIRHRFYGEPGCRRGAPQRDLQETLTGVPRAIVYLGFDSKIPEGFQEFMLDRLGRLGARVAYRELYQGIAAVYDLRRPPDIPASLEIGPVALSNDVVKTLDGCVGIAPARRW